MTDTLVERLPHWDMSVVYPSLDSPEFAAAFDGVMAGIGELARLYDAHNVRRGAAGPVDAALAAAIDEVLTRTNAFYTRYETVEAYIYAFVATEATNELAQARASTLRNKAVALVQLDARLTAWLGTLDVEAPLARSAVARDHAYALRQASSRPAIRCPRSRRTWPPNSTPPAAAPGRSCTTMSPPGWRCRSRCAARRSACR